MAGAPRSSAVVGTQQRPKKTVGDLDVAVRQKRQVLPGSRDGAPAQIEGKVTSRGSPAVPARSPGRSGTSAPTIRPQTNDLRADLSGSKVEVDSPQRQMARKPSAGSVASGRRPSPGASAGRPSQEVRTKVTEDGLVRKATSESARKGDARLASGSTRGPSPTSTSGGATTAKPVSARVSKSRATSPPISSSAPVRRSPTRRSGCAVGRQSTETAPATASPVKPLRKDSMFESGMRVLAQWQGQWYPGEVVSFRDGEAAIWKVQCDADRRGEHAEVSNLAYEFVRGSRVIAEWQGEWLSGTIAEVPAGDIRVFQVQCDADTMGIVTPIASGLSLKLEEHRFAKGSRVQVEWEGAWYGGAVLAMPKEGTPEWTVQCDADPIGQVTPVTSRHRIKPDSAAARPKRSV